MWLLAVFLSSLLVLTGLETVTHGQLTPGGGFQGGVVLASGLYVVYLGTNYATVERFQPDALLESSDGVGAFGYVVIGLLGLLAGAASSATSSASASPGTRSRAAPSRC